VRRQQQRQGWLRGVDPPCEFLAHSYGKQGPRHSASPQGVLREDDQQLRLGSHDAAAATPAVRPAAAVVVTAHGCWRRCGQQSAAPLLACPPHNASTLPRAAASGCLTIYLPAAGATASHAAG
jgi:hypothetical protein